MTVRYSPRGAREEIHVQPRRQNRGKLCARERHADDSPAACPSARAVTPSWRCDRAKTTKYPTKGVLRDFARSNDDFRRV